MKDSIFSEEIQQLFDNMNKRNIAEEISTIVANTQIVVNNIEASSRIFDGNGNTIH